MTNPMPLSKSIENPRKELRPTDSNSELNPLIYYCMFSVCKTLHPIQTQE